ncbi:MAG: DUF4037 domain-containing protein [Anaerolineales bacterium]|nr:DUF4037 domain-containing protein [Anaerolineales bacterium]
MSVHLELARQLAGRFAALPHTVAAALAGSRGAAGAADPASDIDLYVYTRGEIPPAERRAIVEAAGGASRASLDLRYWGPGDEWLHAPTGIEIDLVYFEAEWMAAQLTRVIDEHQASLGYTTCFWHTVRQSVPLADPAGWFADLQRRAAAEYPEPLRRNIVALNHPVLRAIIPSYAGQLEKAVQRRDLVSVNHRLAALLASYFDILFAVNRQLHPGEKRLAAQVLERCPRRPARFEADLEAVLRLTERDLPELPGRLAGLLDRLDDLLRAEGLLPL